MTRYNKAFQGGAGAAVALILSWAVQEFGGIEVPMGIELAVVTLLAALVPRFGPANAD